MSHEDSEDPPSGYEAEVLWLIHRAIPWRARSKREFLRFHRERLEGLFAVFDANLTTQASERAKEIVRDML